MHELTIRRRVSALCIGVLAALMCLSALPARAHAQIASADERCFSETGFCIAGHIRAFWEQNGGLPVIGFPTGPQQTAQVEDQSLQVQQFERQRLELHPENPAPYNVLLGRLGANLLAQTSATFAAESPREGCQFFTQTSFNVCGRFLEAWRASGLEFDGRAGKSYAESLALFGLPLGSERSFQSPDGTTYTMQWFERARFEYHPENPSPYIVLFGLLGNEASGTRPLPTAATGDIVFVSDRDGNNEIYAMNSDGSDQRRLTDDPRDDTSPKWSPDGSKIAFLRDMNDTSADAAQTALWVMNADSSNPVDVGTRIVPPGLSVRTFAWSPDSTRLVLAFERSPATGDIAVLAIDGSSATDIVYTGVGFFARNTNPAWSPDGTKIAFLSDRDGQSRLYVMNADGSNQVKIANQRVFEQPVWTPSSQAVVFTTNYSNPGVFRVDIDGLNLTTLARSENYMLEPAVSPDGVRLVYRQAYRNTQNVPFGGTLWVASHSSAPVARAGTDLVATTTASEPMWAPNQVQLVYTQLCFQSRPADPCNIGTDIMVIDANGVNMRQLTQSSGRNFAPNWRQR